MAYLGLIKRKECWVLTGRGRIVLFITALIILVLTIMTIHPFLTVNRPIHAEILVVEGWLPDYALEKAIREFKTNNYHLIVTTGVPLLKGYHLSEFKTYAEVASATLKQLGLDEKLIVTVPAASVKMDRTYASALAIKNWLSNSNLPFRSLNIYTQGPHARRSRLLFKKALGNKIAVGVIAADDPSYHSRSWWKTSKGVRTIISEIIAYLYARFSFCLTG
jgi:uncharacterized SAM-binding protein YcdF (DUF218 family)